MQNNELPQFRPSSFIQIEQSIFYYPPALKEDLPKKFILPDACDLNHSDRLAETAISWSEKGINFQLEFFSGNKKRIPASSENAIIELFIDTRDVKSAGTTHKFCHHFIFHTGETDGPPAMEISRFRTDDRHPPCDPSMLQLIKKSKCRIHLYLPSESLFGYDPKQFHRMGFTYRIKSKELGTQLFAVHDAEFKIEQHPALWGSLKLMK
jgi:hypothetical protein